MTTEEVLLLGAFEHDETLSEHWTLFSDESFEMTKILPYTLKSATGMRIDFAFPLHAHTASPIRVAQLLTSVLAAVDREIRVLGATANGDVLQALAMALAARSAMIEASSDATVRLARSLVATALEASADADREQLPHGHA